MTLLSRFYISCLCLLRVSNPNLFYDVIKQILFTISCLCLLMATTLTFFLFHSHLGWGRIHQWHCRGNLHPRLAVLPGALRICPQPVSRWALGHFFIQWSKASTKFSNSLSTDSAVNRCQHLLPNALSHIHSSGLCFVWWGFAVPLIKHTLSHSNNWAICISIFDSISHAHHAWE